MGLCAPWDYTYLHNFKLKELEELSWSKLIYWWQQVKSQKLAPLPQPSTNLREEQIFMSGLDTAQWKFLTHPRTSFRINWHWYNKYDTHKSTINKIRLERRTWKMFYTKQINQLKQTCPNTQPAPLRWPSTDLWGGQINISGLDMAHTIFNQKRGQFSGSMNADPINVNK